MKKGLLVVLFLLSFASIAYASLDITTWESTIGGQLGRIIGSGSYCYQEYCLNIGPLFIAVFVLGFIFIWSSASGIAWDGVFILMVMTLAMLSNPVTGYMGTTGWSLFTFIFAFIITAVIFRMILRRG
jgi:hypothetical protein